MSEMLEFGRKEEDEIPESFKANLEVKKMMESQRQEILAVPADNVVSNENVSLEKMSAKDIIAKLKNKQRFEEVRLPSRNFMYDDLGLKPDIPIHVRPMTIEEEKILSTPRLLKSGQAIDKVVESCIHEPISVDKLLSVDVVYLLFYIRGISYGVEYDINIKCPSCDTQFPETINLDTLNVNYCSDGFRGEIQHVLPDSGLNIWLRMPRREDERSLTRQRDMIIKGLGAQAIDDTIVKRNSIMTVRIESITNRMEIDQIMSNLSVKDSNFIRDKISNPEFGIDTQLSIACPYCYHEWELELPIDQNFFFPKTRKA